MFDGYLNTKICPQVCLHGIEPKVSQIESLGPKAVQINIVITLIDITITAFVDSG